MFFSPIHSTWHDEILWCHPYGTVFCASNLNLQILQNINASLWPYGFRRIFNLRTCSKFICSWHKNQLPAVHSKKNFFSKKSQKLISLFSNNAPSLIWSGDPCLSTTWSDTSGHVTVIMIYCICIIVICTAIIWLSSLNEFRSLK